MPNFLTISGRVPSPKSDSTSPRQEKVVVGTSKTVICIEADAAHPNKLKFKCGTHVYSNLDYAEGNLILLD